MDGISLEEAGIELPTPRWEIFTVSSLMEKLDKLPPKAEVKLNMFTDGNNHKAHLNMVYQENEDTVYLFGEE